MRKSKYHDERQKTHIVTATTKACHKWSSTDNDEGGDESDSNLGSMVLDDNKTKINKI